jgi:hypothetical protein
LPVTDLSLRVPSSMNTPAMLPSATDGKETPAVAAPEPTSLSLLAVGLGMIAVAKRRRQWFR